MQRYDPLDDLLRNQRRRGMGKFRKILIVVALLAVAIGVWLVVGESDLGDDSPTEDESLLISMAAAEGVVEGSVLAALEPLSVTPTDESSGVVADPAELTAEWSEGDAVTMRGSIEPNRSLFLELQDRGVPAGSIHAAVTAMSEEFNFRRSRPGDLWKAELSGDGTIELLEYSTSPEDIWRTEREPESGYTTSRVDVPVERRKNRIEGTIQSSLWLSFEASGASANLIASYIDLFAYTIDFNTETQSGDQFTGVYEEVFLDGERLRDGRVLAAKYEGSVGTYYGFYFEDGEGESGYYDENGDNLKRQFLKSPIPIVRITSKFGRRFHPVLKTMKMHAGVDYGAPTGTPVLAAADATVIYAGWKGANGKLVSLRHANGYVTHYAHLSKIEKGVKKGARVKQKQQIGRVGTTGRSTGPHLHYGMTKNGKHINPLEIDFARAEPLEGAQRQLFLDTVVTPLKKELDH